MSFIFVLLEPFLCIARRFDLFLQLAKRSIELQHKGSHLGLVWSFLQPLLLLTVYVFVFGYIFGGSFEDGETKVEYGLKIFIGIICIHFVSEVIAGAPLCIVSNPSYVKKVVFPLEILPPSSVATALFHFSVGLVLAGIGLVFNGSIASSQALLFPLIFLPMILLALGVSWLISALGVFFRDVSQLIPFLSIVLLFSSAVFYSPNDIPEAAFQYLKYNPVMHFIDLTRKCLMTAEPIAWGWLGYLYIIGFATCQIGYYIFSKMKLAFADVI